MKQQHTLQPKLRFPEFEGDWDEIYISNILSIGSGKDYKHLNEGNIPVYGTGGIMTYVDNFIYEGESVGIGRKGTIDKPVFLTGKFWTVDTLFYTHKFSNSLQKFVYNIFQRINWQLYNEASGVPSLSKATIEKIKINIPSLPEQQKIADYLSTVDNKINLLEEKKAQLALYKKAMMQKLFSQEIRFKDDNGNDFPEWEEKRLGEVFSGLKGQGLSKDSLLIEGENNCILYGELFTKYKEIIKSVISKTNTLSGVKSKCGDILIPASTTTNAFDLANATALLLDNVILGGDINILRPKQKLSSEFYAYYLSNYKKHELGKLGQGITIVHLYYTHFKNIMIDLPSLPEQQKIADFLSAIDESIEKVNEQITQTQSFKKAMLQQLFV